MTSRPCTPELAAIDTRLAGLDRARAATRDRLREAGFERTVAELAGDATAPPGLAIDAARSADALEQLLEGRSLAYPALANEVDWIALNWFDSALKRWTPGHIRRLTSMTAREFGELKQDTVALRQVLSDARDLRTRREGLANCAGRALAASTTARAAPRAGERPGGPSASANTCVDRAPHVHCTDPEDAPANRRAPGRDTP